MRVARYIGRGYRQVKSSESVESAEGLPRFVGYEYIQTPISARHHLLSLGHLNYQNPG